MITFFKESYRCLSHDRDQIIVAYANYFKGMSLHGGVPAFHRVNFMIRSLFHHS